MKTLRAIVSCEAHSDYRTAIRETWLPLGPKEKADVLFFMGLGATSLGPDEIILPCDDSYGGLPNKVQEIVRWAHGRAYDFVLKCDNDVILRPQALLSSGFEHYDFVGCQEPSCKPGEIHTPWGFCYWLSKKAMKSVIDSPLPGMPGSIHGHIHNNDEAWISTILHYKGIFLHSDARYHLHTRNPDPRPELQCKRPLRRPKPPEKVPVDGTFAFCVYLNWEGFHMTPKEVILKEFYKIFSEKG
jgi:hypothetical protein